MKCIDSWRKYFPDYIIKEWNESNYDVHKIPYIHEAYDAKKYAFVSDYARFDILYRYGGIYFDTDVQVIASFEDIISKGPFMGIEKLNPRIHDVNKESMVNPGLGLGCSPKHLIFGEILDYYKTLRFLDEKGDMLPGTVVHHTTKVLMKHGFECKNVQQVVDGITIYPSDVFCPMDSTTGLTELTEKSVSIHQYTCSWMDQNSFRFRLHLLKNSIIRIFGDRLIMEITRLLHRK